MNDFVILTADLDHDSFSKLNDWRLRYFPQERNLVPAHLTLFHQFPRQALRELRLPPGAVIVRFTEPFFMGKGFAIRGDCEELLSLRQQLLLLPYSFTDQDRKLKKLHVTIQNKMAPADAKNDFHSFLSEWKNFNGWVRGLRQWDYQGGEWALEKVISFS